MLNKKEQVDTRVAILEEKFSVYEQMMTKMESAIHTISEAYQGISRMLSIHEEKIGNNSHSDSLILQTIKDVETKNTEEHKKVLNKIEQLEIKFEENDKLFKNEFENKLEKQNIKIEGLMRFRLLIGGALIFIGFLFSQQQIRLLDFLPQQAPPDMIRPPK